jgi:23S rRNA (cytosine1962-C5)-methyltransferase
MFTLDDYELLDFGDGRRLERFGDFVLDRPCPVAANHAKGDAALWVQADAWFDGREEMRGEWTERRVLPGRWTAAYGNARFELKRTEFGHVGLFPEQADNWRWIARAVSHFRSGESQGESETVASSASDVGGRASNDGRPPCRVLNLFAYTGGSTFAATAAGAVVVHVDAAKNVVAWARRNAELSGLDNAPIHWIAEDATKFCKREVKRGNRYDAVILDPPSYGHGPRGEVWRLSKHLPRLLDLCAELTDRRPLFLLLTCHTPGYDGERLRQMLQDAFGESLEISAGSLSIRASTGRSLPSGVFVRCQTASTSPT